MMIESHYFNPQTVKATDAAKVLEFLNSVQDAEAIAARIEFEGELDIGRALGMRLLTAREALGGSFVTLQQVADVPYIGPERFTEIVAALAGLPLPWLNVTDNSNLYNELHRLRAMVEQFTSAAAVQATIEVRQDIASPLLGQPLSLVIKAVDSNGRALVNRPLTLETNQGVLTTQYGLEVRRGEVVETVTGVDGSARVQLAYQTYERLSEEQRAALESELGSISQTAESPADLLDGFNRISASYEHERNRHLRGALDVYFKEMEAQLKATVNPINHLIAWRFNSALVRVYLHPPFGHEDQKPAAVVTMATHVVRWRNWVLPWYQSYLQRIQQRNDLSQTLRVTLEKTAASPNLAQSLLNEAHNFMANQYGRIGAVAGQEIASKSMLQFLAKDITALPPDKQVSLFPALGIAAETIKASGQGALALVNQTRSELETQLSSVQLDSAAISAEINTVNNKIDTFNSEYAQFQSQKTLFDTNYATFNTQFATFETNFSVFDANFKDFDNRFSRFSTNLATFDANFTNFSTRYQQFNQDVKRIDTDLTALKGDVQLVTKDVSTINTRLTGGNIR